MSSLWQHILLAIIGLGGGLAVGSGFVAFITVLDIIPRLAQLTNAHRYIRALEWSLVSGALFFTLADFFNGWPHCLSCLLLSTAYLQVSS